MAALAGGARTTQSEREYSTLQCYPFTATCQRNRKHAHELSYVGCGGRSISYNDCGRRDLALHACDMNLCDAETRARCT